ncbi:Fic family protein [Frateuria defendens]|uniref:Fic family protein n=1 Tax=Frateuria defendens TaxID=2219559 RepID=UPI001929C425|nr:Fic family protein [Frateuria defendens]
MPPLEVCPMEGGACVRYPSHDLIEQQVTRIGTFWVRHYQRARAAAGVVAMTALMNLHPFADGNGRVGRMLFHWTLRSPALAAAYLPLHELGQLSRGGYLIRLRQAQYHGTWEPLFTYLTCCARSLFG